MASGAKDLQIIEMKDMISQLNSTIKAQSDLIISLQKMMEDRNKKEDEKDLLIANLNSQLEYLKQKLYGSSSEKRNDLLGQLSIFDQDTEEEKIPEIIEPEMISVRAHKKERRPKVTYEEQFKNLPSRQIEVDTLSAEEKQCSICQSQMIPIGHEVIRTEIEYTPAQLTRIEYIATTYECPVCKDTEEPVFIKDEGTPALIPGSYVSSSLAAHVMFAKYVDALPLYRQEKDFELLGVCISRGTMANWIITCGQKYLQPMFDYFHRELLKRQFFMLDETPLQVLNEPDRRPQSKSYIWVIRSGEDRLHPIVLFQYTPTRNGEHAAEFLKGAGSDSFYMADGFGGYNKLKHLKRCICYAHIRRYLIEAIPKGHEKDYSHPAVQGVLYCNKLFEYERTYKEKGLSYQQVQKRRQKDQRPVIEAFIKWLDQQRPKKGDRLDRAVTYISNRRDLLMNYLEDGRCSLSNNLSENAIRPVVLGRKNWLFSESQDGANASMLVYTMVEMARTQELNPYKYLKFLLEQRPSNEMSEEEFENLAPWSETAIAECSINVT